MAVDWSQYQEVSDPTQNASSVDWSKYQEVPQASQPTLLDHLKNGLINAAHFGQGAVQGVSDLGEGLAKETVVPLANALNIWGKIKDTVATGLSNTPNRPTASLKQYSAPNGDVFAYNPAGKNTTWAKAGNITSQVLTGLALPEFADATLPKIAEQSVQNAVISKLNGGNPLIGGALGLVGGAAGQALPAALKGLANKAAQPGSLLRTPQVVSQYQKVLSDTPVDFGSLVGSPKLSKTYNYGLQGTMLGGVEDGQQKLINESQNSAQTALQSLLGTTKEQDIPDALTSKIKDNYNNNYSQAKQQFQDVFKQADQRGIQATDLSNITDAAAKLLGDSKNPLNLTQLPSPIQNKLQQIIENNKNGNNDYQ